MTLSVTHAKVSSVANDPAASAAGEVLPSDWNAAHTLTGTADATQLNANVVQSIVNDTNVTGSIATQALTLGWTGTLAVARGGTGGGTASGTLLDNITGFASTGFINRTGAGAYSFVASTGSGNVVLATSPTLVTPTLGVASATSLTAANIYGGSSVGSTLNLQSTSSGSPSGDSVTITAGGSARITALSNGNLGFGDTNPQRPFIFNMNTAQGVAITGWQGFNVYSPDSVAGIGINLLHVASAGGITDARVNGTLASPSNLNSGDQFAHFAGSGWGAGALHGDAIAIDGFATENWTASYGSYMKLSATLNGGTNNVQVMRLQSGVIIGAHQTTDPGTTGFVVASANAANYSGTLAGQLNVIAADSAQSSISLDTYGAGPSVFIFRAAGGTLASPSNLTSGTVIGVFGARPYVGGAFPTSNVARIDLVYNDTSPNWGSYIAFKTSNPGTQTLAQAMRVMNGAIVGAGTSDPGAGNLTASGTVQGAGLLSNGDPGGTASNTTITNTNSTTISTGVGSVKMSSANNATNAAWLKIYIGATAYWIPGWTTNSP